ncbi:hypothetical protein HN873_026322, partial [Arachis hypogaea]
WNDIRIHTLFVGNMSLTKRQRICIDFIVSSLYCKVYMTTGKVYQNQKRRLKSSINT